ncbi:MAG: hypothetical protein FRX48_06923 [Lasallia pustulata]|uniref:Secreted protein n=1 Tax=Lasallia pustulata TaxID=136370 RepID=A0A5M8PK22_9LECA|nr:MAG: hypothetical protein FRX48_06923 [Lasallia pustulata]
MYNTRSLLSTLFRVLASVLLKTLAQENAESSPILDLETCVILQATLTVAPLNLFLGGPSRYVFAPNLGPAPIPPLGVWSTSKYIPP